MKKIYTLILIFFLCITSLSVSAKFIVCKNIKAVWPFVKNVSPVPFPMCYYSGVAVHPKSGNHCKQIRKRLEKRYGQKLQKWKCWFILDKEKKQAKYNFRFAPLKK